MPSAKKTWAEKMKAKPPHQVILEKDFAGVPKGSKLHISSPAEIVACWRSPKIDPLIAIVFTQN